MFNLQNLSISRKMALLSGVSLTALLVIGVVAIWITEKLSEDIDDLSSVQIVSMREAMQADMMHDGLRAVVFRSIIAGQTNNETDKQDCATELKEFTESFKKSLEDLNRLPLDEITKKSVNEVFPELEKYIAKSEVITQLALSNQTDKALKEVPKFQEQFKILEDRMETLDNLIEQNSQKSRDKSAKETTYAQITLITGTILGFVFAVLLSYLISRSTVLRLRALAGIVNSLSAKNIEEKIDCQSKDEIGIVTCAFRDAYRYLERIAQAAEGLSQGKFDVKLEQRSEDDLLSRNFMTVTDTLQSLIKETSTLTKGAQSGDLSCRGNSQQFQGGYRELIDNINITLDSIANPINEASEVLEKIANRDLTPQMEGKYQGDFAKIKNSVNLAAENLKQGFEQVANSADQVASAAEQISEGSQTLAQGASEQASSLEEVSSNLHEISSMTKQNAISSTEASILSKDVLNTAKIGMQNMHKLNEAVERIKNSSDSTAKIVKTIEEIAFQTNLLALNAAVEAARAGDAGKGFAVVAEEVRNLALRSAEAARNSASLIGEAVVNTGEGVELNSKVFKNLEEINSQIHKVSDVIAEIATATEQQNKGIEQIDFAVEQMSLITQQVAANSEESASSAEELSGQSQEMIGLIDTYKLDKQPNNSVRISFTDRVNRNSKSDSAFSVGNFKNAGSPKKKNFTQINSKSKAENFIPFEEIDSRILKDF